jgi:hypothetical protein
MGDAIQFLVDEEVSEAEAPFLAGRLRARLIEEGWIEREVTNDCALGGRGHRPGPLVRSSFAFRQEESDFCELLTNGVVIEAKRFTSLECPHEWDLFVCPQCEEQIDAEQLDEALEAWYAGRAPRAVICAGCGRAGHPREWRSTDPGQSPITFGNLVVRFYNWPGLDSPRWKRDIVDEVRKIVGRPLSLAWGRL